MKKRMMSILLTVSFVIGMMAAYPLPAKAAVTADFSDSEMTVFDALGIETVPPEGYSEDESIYDSPYGKTFSTVANVDELLILAPNDKNGTSDVRAEIRLYGHQNDLLGNISDIFKNSVTNRYGVADYADHLTRPVALTVEGNFSVDNQGQKKNVAFLTLSAAYVDSDDSSLIGKNRGAYSNLSIGVLDPVTGKSDTIYNANEVPGFYSWDRYADKALYIGNPSSAQNQNFKLKDGTNTYTRSFIELYMAYNYLKLDAGDFDGDGIDEIAVYIGEQGNARIEIWKLQKTDGNGYLNPGHYTTDRYGLPVETEERVWEIAWTYGLSVDSVRVPNMVSMTVGDYNKDGVDDLAVAADYYGSDRLPGNVSSRMIIMMGADNNEMLQKTYEISLEAGNDYVYRPGVTTGDADGDGYNELVLGGSLGRSDSNSRYLAIYEWNGDGFSVAASQNIHLFEEKNGTRVYQNISDRSAYYCGSYAPANLAVGHFYGLGETPCIYLDGIMIGYTDDGFDVLELVDKDIRGGLTDYYVEWNARAVDLNGDGKDSLFVMTANIERFQYNSFTSILKQLAWLSGGSYKGEYFLTGLDLTKGDSYSVSRIHRQSGVYYTEPRNSRNYSALTFCVPNTDHDTTILKYTGEHYYTYSDPKVMAVLASSPYFQDLANSNPDCGMMESSTGYEVSKGTATGSSISGGFSVGVYTSWEHDFEMLGVTLASSEAELAINNSFTWETENSSSLEYSRGYSTFAGSDAVIMFSIPIETYLYEAMVPNGDGTYDIQTMTVNIPYEPSYQTIPLEDYRKLQPDYKNILPQIGTDVLSHTVGYPSSYPSSQNEFPSNRYRTIEYDGDPSRVGQDGVSSQSQSITLSSEEAKSFSYEFSIETKAGFGAVGVMVGVTAGTSVGAGTVKVDSQGTSFSAEVCSLPEESKQYGYSYNWKLATFMYGNPLLGSSFPVVTYLVTDVMEPPHLPENFGAVNDETTTDSVVLEWDYQGNASAFILYRYYQATSDAGFYEIATINADDSDYYEIMNGVKHYTYQDIGLSPNHEYQYKIQTVGNAQPNLSVPSLAFVTYTKPDSGVPKLTVDYTALTAYADARVSATVTITNKEELAGARLSYQWQKQNSDGNFETLNGMEGNVLTIAYGDAADAGVYRCRVSARVDQNLVVVYSENVMVTFARYSSEISDIEIGMPDGDGKYPVTVTIGGDSASTPVGMLTLTLSNNASETVYMTPVTGNKTTFSIKPTNDIYFVDASYGGSAVYKPSNYQPKEPLILQVGQSAGTLYEYKEEYAYGESIEITEWTISEDGDILGKPFFLAKENLSWQYTEGGRFTPLVDLTEQWSEQEKPTLHKVISRLFEEQRAGAYGFWQFIGNNGKAYRFFIGSVRTGEGEEYGAPGGIQDVYTISIHDLNEEGWSAFWNQVIHSWRINGVIDEWKETDNLLNPEIQDMTISLYGASIEEYESVGGCVYRGSYMPSGGTVKDHSGFDPSSLKPGSYKVKLTLKSASVTEYYRAEKHLASVYRLYDTYEFSLNISGNTYPVSVSVRNDTMGEATISYPEHITTAAVGQTLIFSARPYSGFLVDHWTLNGQKIEGSEGKSTLTLTQSTLGVDVQAVFVGKNNALTVGVWPQAAEAAGNTVSAIGENGFLFTNGNVYRPGSIVFTFGQKAVEGWHFSRWEYIESGGSAVYTGDSVYTLTIPDARIQLNAVFERDRYSLALGSGLVAYDEKGELLNDLSAVIGDTVVTVKPNSGFRPVNGADWLVNGEKVQPKGDSYTFIMTKNTTVQVSVASAPYTVTLNQATGGGATATALGQVNGGEEITLTADPMRGFTFDHWMLFTGDDQEPVAIETNPCSVTVTADMKITPVFSVQTPKTVVIGTENGIYSKVEWEINSRYDVSDTDDSIITVYPGESVTLYAVPGSGRCVSGWRSGGIFVLDGAQRRTYSYDELADTLNVVFDGITEYTVTFRYNMEVSVYLTSDGKPYQVKSGDKVPSGVKLEFRYFALDEEMILHWLNGDKIIDCGGYFSTVSSLNENIDMQVYTADGHGIPYRDKTDKTHKGGIPTCTTGALCIHCGREYRNPDWNNHTSDAFIYKDNQDGTHTVYHACCERYAERENHAPDKKGSCICGYSTKDDAENPNDPSGALSVGVIVLIAVGFVILAAGIGVAIVLIIRKKKAKGSDKK